MVRIRGFTLIELLIVLAIIATLLSITAPRYFKNVDSSKEKVLRINLATVRDSIDKYYADKGYYPESLQTLVDDEYLKSIPQDPITNTLDTWILSPPKNEYEHGVADVHSGSKLISNDGTLYSEW